MLACDYGLTPGVIAGIVIGVLLVACALVAVVIAVIRCGCMLTRCFSALSCSCPEFKLASLFGLLRV